MVLYVVLEVRIAVFVSVLLLNFIFFFFYISAGVCECGTFLELFSVVCGILYVGCWFFLSFLSTVMLLY
jgi:hypothetical protein